LPAGIVPRDHQRLQIGARRVDGGRAAGAPGANNDDVMHENINLARTRAACPGVTAGARCWNSQQVAETDLWFFSTPKKLQENFI